MSMSQELEKVYACIVPYMSLNHYIAVLKQDGVVDLDVAEHELKRNALMSSAELMVSIALLTVEDQLILYQVLSALARDLRVQWESLMSPYVKKVS